MHTVFRLFYTWALLVYCNMAFADSSSLGLSNPLSVDGQLTMRKAPSLKQENFLACTASCGFDGESTNPLTCLDACKQQSGLNDQEFAAYIRTGINSSAAGSVAGGWHFGFTCDPLETRCSCKGFFDCKILEKSKCCNGTVNACDETEGQGETCYCDKSPQCSL